MFIYVSVGSRRRMAFGGAGRNAGGLWEDFEVGRSGGVFLFLLGVCFFFLGDCHIRRLMDHVLNGMSIPIEFRPILADKLCLL